MKRPLINIYLCVKLLWLIWWMLQLRPKRQFKKQDLLGLRQIKNISILLCPIITIASKKALNIINIDAMYYCADENNINIDIRSSNVVYITIGEYTYYIDDSTGEQIIEVYPTHDF